MEEMVEAIHLTRVAGLGVEPSLRDYEPHVQPYTTPHISDNVYYITEFGKIRLRQGSSVGKSAAFITPRSRVRVSLLTHCSARHVL